MKHLIYLAILLCASLSASGATINAASGSKTDVQNAVNAAQNGDTVTIPGGSNTWSGGITIAKDISIIGAGTNLTQLAHYNIPEGAFFTVVVPYESAKQRISGIFFRKPETIWTADNYAILAVGSNYRGEGTAIKALRIDNCHFYGGKRVIYAYGRVEGVIDHCRFERTSLAIAFTGDNNYAWARPIQPGSTNALYIEDCYFQYSDDTKGTPIYHQEAARTVARYNTFAWMTGSTVGNGIEAHGNQDLDTTTTGAFRGQVLTEFYNNTLLGSSSGYRYTYWRGGQVIAFNNTFTGVDTAMFLMTEEESWQTQFFSPLRTVWPAQDQITNSFFWNNTMNGVVKSGISWQHGNDFTFIQQNRDFWLEAPNANNGRPAGIYANYTPLVYPHPLVSGSATSAGSLSFSASTYSVSEGGGSVTITVVRSGGSSGAVGCSYATSNSTGLSGVNYTATSGTLSWSAGDSASKTFTVPIINASTYGNPTFTVALSTATGGATIGLGSATVIIQGVGSPPESPLLTGLTWAATSGQITAPFVASGSVWQSVETADYTQAGIASYTFTNTAGNFLVTVNLNAADDGENSLFISFNGETPQVWDMPVTDGFENRVAAWTRTSPAQNPKVWTLSAGTNTLYIRGREANVRLNTVTVTPESATVVELAMCQSLFSVGENAGTVSVEVCRTGDTNEVVTVSYATANGTAIAGTDYTTTSGTLTFNAGVIQTNIVVSITDRVGTQGTRGFTVTLSNPSGATLLPGGDTVAMVTITDAAPALDTTPPTITISGPNVDISDNDSSEVFWLLTYVDENFHSSWPSTANVTLNKTGTANGTLNVTGAPGYLCVVLVSNITGRGTLSFSVAAGTARDWAGNLAGSAGPSTAVSVKNIVQVDTVRAGVIRLE